MRRKKTLLIVAAMILTIATLAVLSFVRSKMEANDQSAKTASVHGYWPLAAFARLNVLSSFPRLSGVKIPADSASPVNLSQISHATLRRF